MHGYVLALRICHRRRLKGRMQLQHARHLTSITFHSGIHCIRYVQQSLFHFAKTHSLELDIFFVLHSLGLLSAGLQLSFEGEDWN